MNKVGAGLVNMSFAGADQAKQVYDLESEIDRLKTEIDQLRKKGEKESTEGTIEELRTQLVQGGVLEVGIEQISRNPDQPRQTFPAESITAMALSLQTEGQQEPIILIEREESGYFLFDGERRWRGAQELQWETLKAVIIPEPEALHRRVLLANLHREELNALDIAEAVIKEISNFNGIAPLEIPKVLRTVVRRLERQGHLSKISEIVIAPFEQQQTTLQGLEELSDAERAVLSTLLGLQLNPASVNANIFPMVNLADDLKEAIREKGLGGNHALALNKINAAKLDITEGAARKRRKKLTQKVLSDKLPVAQVRKLVKDELTTQNDNQVTEAQKQVNAVTQSLSKLPAIFETLDVEELGQLRNIMAKVVEQIETYLSDTETEDFYQP